MGKENKTVYAILGLLSHEDMTGYDIKKRIDETLNFFWNAGFGQIYPALKQLEGAGFVTKRNEEGENKQKRIVYSITESGEKQLKEWLAVPAEKEYVKYEILLKLFFGGLLPIDDNIKKIEEFRARYIKGKKVLDDVKKDLNGVTDENEDHLYFMLSVLMGEKVYKAYIEWAGEAIELLKKHKGSAK